MCWKMISWGNLKLTYKQVSDELRILEVIEMNLTECNLLLNGEFEEIDPPQSKLERIVL